MRIRLKERRAETKDVLSFVFDLGGQLLPYQAGQYTYYELDSLTFPDELGNQRHFTISCSPSDQGILMFTTRMRGSGFKETLRHAAIGYELSCEEPRGRFVLQQGDHERYHVFIAGGIGITPYRSILRYAFHTKAQLEVVLLYFNHSSAAIVFRSELEQLAKEMPNFSLVHVLSEPEPGWTGERGALDQSVIERHVTRPTESIFWISGPPGMVSAFNNTLLQSGIKEESIRTDNFLGY